MYTLTKPKAPSQIVASVRRGPSRPFDLESYVETRDKTPISAKSFNRAEGNDEQFAEMSHQQPKPTFQQQQSRRTTKQRQQPSINQDPTLHENHMEMATLLSREWKKVQDCQIKGKDADSGYETYLDKEPRKRSIDSNFQPFDLEKFWGTRTLTNALGKPTS
ncbi:unnamed protein product [Lymnaea stagnalis]|uniref:Uncharacterized protein n=1 Tax=Lymnaea stagnalis TaxID=6523 RepID=A0AAV2I4F1_LYMST